MKSKLIKTEVNYLLKNEEGVIIASTSIKKGISSLSKQNCDEIFGVVEVEKLAIDIWKDLGVFTENDKHLWFGGFRNGFNKAMELNKDKLFTLEEVHKLLRLIHILPNFELEQFEDENNVLQIDTFISHHIQQPTEIDVEIESKIAIDGHTILGYELDSEGCLILKRVV